MLSPCVLPLVPAYLGYLTGASLEATSAQSTVAMSSGGGAVAVASGPPAAPARAPSPFLHSLAFVSGFSFVFVSFGISIGILGYFLRDNQDYILKASGTLLIIMGLHLAGVITIPFLDQERRLDMGRGTRIAYTRSFLVGSTFAAGWSPCIGPTLGAIFALAISSDKVLSGGVLLSVYSAGLSVPFIAMGLAYNSVKPLYTRIKRYIGIINFLSGALLIIVGILVFTDSLVNLNQAFNFGFLNDVSAGA